MRKASTSTTKELNTPKKYDANSKLMSPARTNPNFPNGHYMNSMEVDTPFDYDYDDPIKNLPPIPISELNFLSEFNLNQGTTAATVPVVAITPPDPAGSRRSTSKKRIPRIKYPAVERIKKECVYGYGEVGEPVSATPDEFQLFKVENFEDDSLPIIFENTDRADFEVVALDHTYAYMTKIKPIPGLNFRAPKSRSRPKALTLPTIEQPNNWPSLVSPVDMKIDTLGETPEIETEAYIKTEFELPEIKVENGTSMGRRSYKQPKYCACGYVPATKRLKLFTGIFVDYMKESHSRGRKTKANKNVGTRRANRTGLLILPCPYCADF